MSNITTTSTLVDGLTLFYREAGPPNAPVILLLHGFPSSSHQYRNLIPLLSHLYHIIAPDLPGFGFTVVPPNRNYIYTFENLTTTISSFLDALKISKFAVYMFDYGAPIGLRLALRRPEAITAIVSQNGNAYVDGLGPAWAPFKQYWKTDSDEDREALRSAMLGFEPTKWQYTHGSTDPEGIAPESFFLDYALLSRPGIKDIQLDIFRDYQTNVELYPQFQDYFRKTQVPLLAAWGKNDGIFLPAGAEAFKRDLKNAEVHLLDAGHFAAETNTKEIGTLMLAFLSKHGI